MSFKSHESHQVGASEISEIAHESHRVVVAVEFGR